MEVQSPDRAAQNRIIVMSAIHISSGGDLSTCVCVLSIRFVLPRITLMRCHLDKSFAVGSLHVTSRDLDER